MSGTVLNPWLEERLDRLAHDGPVLDLGCGRGYWMEHLARRGTLALGVERELERAAQAADHGPVVSGDAAHLPLPDGCVGLVWCIHVLDLGCGRGYWMEHLARRGTLALGVERELERAAQAADHGPVVSGDAAHLPLPDRSVGLVWCIHVLHHLPHPARVLAEVRRVLRPGGALVLAESVDDNPLLRLGRRLHASWDGVGIHARFTARSLLDEVAAAGLDVVERRQHSLLSFGAWALPAPVDRPAWRTLTGLEDRLPRALSRWGAHLECVARRP